MGGHIASFQFAATFYGCKQVTRRFGATVRLNNGADRMGRCARDVCEALMIAPNSDGKLVRRPLSPHLQVYRWPVSMGRKARACENAR